MQGGTEGQLSAKSRRHGAVTAQRANHKPAKGNALEPMGLGATGRVPRDAQAAAPAPPPTRIAPDREIRRLYLLALIDATKRVKILGHATACETAAQIAPVLTEEMMAKPTISLAMMSLMQQLAKDDSAEMAGPRAALLKRLNEVATKEWLEAMKEMTDPPASWICAGFTSRRSWRDLEAARILPRTAVLAGRNARVTLPRMSVIAQRLWHEIESATEPVQAAVLDFILFVKAKGDEQRISRTPGVCGGDACLGSTRIAVWMLEAARRAGVTDAGLLQDYPSLNARDLAAAWAYVDQHGDEIDAAIRANDEA